MKKKLLIMSCIAAICLSFAACGKEDTEPEKDSDSKDSSVSVSADEESSAAEDSEKTEPAEEESKADEKPDEDSSKAADGDLDDGTAADIIGRMVDNVNSDKTCKMTGKMDLTGYVYISYAGETMEQDMKNISEIEAYSNKNGQHTVSKNIRNDGFGDEVDFEDVYTDLATGVTYTSYDEGKTWYKGTADDEDDDSLNMDSIFESKAALEDAAVEKSADGYVITIDVSKLDAFTDSMTGSLSGVEFSGNIVITIDKDYYPVSIEMTDMKFDTSVFEEMLKGMGGDAVSPDEIDVKFDLGISFIMNFSNWNDISDDLVMPSDDIVSKAIAE